MTPTTVNTTKPIDDYQLEDRYRRSSGRVFMTGTQALVRLPLIQRQLDSRAGLNTAGYVTGYRGSPLGGYDQALWDAKKYLEANNITFVPAVNEDLAATAVIGTQQVEIDPNREVDGVFSIWYGKGPGVDRAGDALKHGNGYGSSPHGGVLVVAGDDHGCVSSSMSHQSDVAFMAWYMPTLNPANIAEYIDFGLYGIALSRYSGMWVGFKAISEAVESAASIELTQPPSFIIPQDYTPPEGGLNFRWPDLPGPQIEARMVDKIKAIHAFVRANPIDKKIYDIPNARMGIITTGKAHLDLIETLSLLGVDETRARELGIDIYKIGLVWPIEPLGVRQFLQGKEEVLVIEEKRGIIESQLKELLYDYPGDKPKRMVGKYDEYFQPLVSWTAELSPSYLAPIVAGRISYEFAGIRFDEELEHIRHSGVKVKAPGGVRRLPYFCSGCPHNTSTKVPDGSQALAGIGCHFMASWMNRNTSSLIQMGGEGVNWVGKSRFTGNHHIFQNLGEGTYFHSGYMAIRQAIAANINITYKILFNDAVAMTGGQPVDGAISVPAIANQVHSEGVKRVAVISDEPEKYSDKSIFPAQTTFHHRDELDSVQRELREIKGVTALIYDQTCAAEKRRRRKRGTFPDPAKRIFINELVCEGCGDCSKQSNCLSIFPLETEFGRKRKIDQSSCNKDYSCVKGFCPSFVTVEGGTLRKHDAVGKNDEFERRVKTLPQPEFSPLTKPFDLLVGGVGGTGVVTVGALITMAAHLEGKGASVLDFMGFAQKGGSVLSYVRLAAAPDQLNQVRIDHGMADALIACDMVVGTDPRAINVLRNEHTRVIVNLSELPSGDFVLDRDANMQADLRVRTLEQAVGPNRVSTLDANNLAERLLGNTVFSNIFLLGYSWQLGLVPVSLQALLKAIDINGVAVAANKQGFHWGRMAAVDFDFVKRIAGDKPVEIATDLNSIIEKRYRFLVDYQNRKYADRYRQLVDQVKAKEASLGVNHFALTEAVAKYLFKLMAYKDEYEVARLYTDGQFLAKLANTFEGDYRLSFNMAPPLLARQRDEQGRPKKLRFGQWMLSALKVTAKLKFLRGTPFDPFGRSTERKTERALIEQYRATITDILGQLKEDNLDTAVAIAKIPDQIRGYGPVKDAAIEEAKVQNETLLNRFHGKEAALKFVEVA